MKTLREHPFFKAVQAAEDLHKKAGAFGCGNANRLLFHKALRKAHPFIFSRSVTNEKRMMGRGYMEFDDLVEDFSIPFSTSLYLMTDCPWLKHPNPHPDLELKDGIYFDTTELLGYLVDEITTENFRVFEVHLINFDPKAKTGAKPVMPCINQFEINLKTLSFAFNSAKAIGIELFESKPEAHTMKETCAVMQFTSSISVKRIGIEVSPQFNIKTRGLGAGYTSIKRDNLIHIADKVEYEYIKPMEESNIDWEFTGWWRGHWRALYFPDSMKDQFSRRIVDYARTGKNRAGEYNVPGYTWVTEHTRGDPRLAEIIARMVKHG